MTKQIKYNIGSYLWETTNRQRQWDVCLGRRI